MDTNQTYHKDRTLLQDTFGRVHNYLRISLTDHCNLRCLYCMPEKHYNITPGKNRMTADEIETLAKTFVRAGITKIRLTGGEPLIREDAEEIIKRLGQLPVELTLTTNAIRIDRFIDTLHNAGVKSVNISLDTLDHITFHRITQRNQFHTVLQNIQRLLEAHFSVKINMVVMRNINDHEVNAFVDWTKEMPVQVRFIEFMPFEGNQWSSNQVVPMSEILQSISKHYVYEAHHREINATANVFSVAGHKGSFAVISTMSTHFCSDCNRIRLTADGKLKNCLFSKSETDLLTALRSNEDVMPLILKNIAGKHAKLGGQLSTDFHHIEREKITNRSMISIGG